MNSRASDDELCQYLIEVFLSVFPGLMIKGGAQEPLYVAPKGEARAVLFFRDNYPRSLLHEVSHYCLAGDRRRKMDDFGFWYSPCGRTEEEQARFEFVEARPQGLEKAMCEIVGIPFSPSLDDFSGRPASQEFLERLNDAYSEMVISPPVTARKALVGLANYFN